jgi:hypothetical protein
MTSFLIKKFLENKREVMLFATDKNLFSTDSYRKVMANLKEKKCGDYLFNQK